MFCSSFTVAVWMKYLQQRYQQKQKMTTSQANNIQQFITNIDPMNCTPMDLKYFVNYFPELFAFAGDMTQIKTGAILKCNFFGAPRYGHTCSLWRMRVRFESMISLMRG